GRDTLHELDQPLKILAYVSNHWGPLLIIDNVCALVRGVCECTTDPITLVASQYREAKVRLILCLFR
ncbi:hypothetical protein ACPV4X_25975, partial [Vibrio owensii]|uniref:hypothetical protein n=1 Tax=Vibrio owensii TaxID=696485 RepID=UPI004068C0F3